MNLRQQLTQLEGCEHQAYPDPLTGGAPWTIGKGHTGPEVHPGLVWSDEQIDAAFESDIAEKTRQVRAIFPEFDRLNEPRQAVLIGMQFQLKGGIHLWPRFLGFVRDEDHPNAAEEIRQSKWARQTPKRAVRLAFQMETGAWQ